jgi:hypothetical protein
LPALLLVIGAIVLVMLGVKNLQIGGLLARLLGKSGSDKKAVDVANTIPKDRVDKDGKLIPVGTPDEHGITQAKVVSIEPPGLFSNPKQVTIKAEDGTKHVVDLPTGVRARDVDKVVIVKPEIFAVTVTDSSKVPKKTVDDLLKRYGS